VIHRSKLFQKFQIDAHPNKWSCNIGQKSASVRKRAKLIGKGKSEDDGRAVGSRTRADSLNLAARKDRELPPSPTVYGDTEGDRRRYPRPKSRAKGLDSEKNGAVVRTEHWRGRLFEPYDPANPPPRLPSEPRKRTTSRHRGSKEDRYGTPKQRSHPTARTALRALCALTAPIPRPRRRGDELGTTS